MDNGHPVILGQFCLLTWFGGSLIDSALRPIHEMLNVRSSDGPLTLRYLSLRVREMKDSLPPYQKWSLLKLGSYYGRDIVAYFSKSTMPDSSSTLSSEALVSSSPRQARKSAS